MDKDLQTVFSAISRLANRTGNLSVDELAERHGNEYSIYYEVYDKLDDSYRILKYLSKPILGEYHLYENEDGRFESFEGCYYTSGSPIEFYHDERWCLSRVESYNGKYYIVDYKDVSLENLKVRVRSN